MDNQTLFDLLQSNQAVLLEVLKLQAEMLKKIEALEKDLEILRQRLNDLANR
jgi:hypothetical protein